MKIRNGSGMNRAENVGMPVEADSLPVVGEAEKSVAPPVENVPTGLRRKPVASAVEGFVLDEEVWVAGERDEEILEGMAEAFWGSAWADAMDEHGEGVGMGAQVMDVMPEVPEATKAFARESASKLCAANGVKTLGELLVRAAKADGCEDPGENYNRFGTYARSFGSDMAMQMMGHGVSWADDHEDFECEVPYVTYGSIEAMGVIAEQQIEKLAEIFKNRSIMDLADLPSPEAIAAGEPLAVGAVKDGVSSEDQDEISEAMDVFLLEKLGVHDLLGADQLEARSLADYIPTYEAIQGELRKASPLLQDLTLIQEEDLDADESRLVMRKARFAQAEIGEGFGIARAGEFRVSTANNWEEADALLKWMAETMEGEGVEEVPVQVEFEGWERFGYLYPLRKEDANGATGTMLREFIRAEAVKWAAMEDAAQPSLSPEAVAVLREDAQSFLRRIDLDA